MFKKHCKNVIRGLVIYLFILVVFTYGAKCGQNFAIKNAQLESICENGDYYISYIDGITGNREIYEYHGVNE